MRKTTFLATVLTVFHVLSSCSGGVDKDAYLDPKQPTDKRVKSLMSQMTLEEKVGQLCQYVGIDHMKESLDAKKNTDATMGGIDAQASANLELEEYKKDIETGKVGSCLHVTSVEEANALQELALKSRLKIPLLMGTDAIHGNGMHGGMTIYPTLISIASSFNPELQEKISEEAAKEMRASGMHWSFSPNIEVARDPRWGRTGETFGEDTYLVTEFGLATIKGLQGKNGVESDRVLATAKHMIAGSQPTGGINAAPMDLSEQQLREVFLPPFIAAINDANVYTVMPAHNELNGIPCHANPYLLKDILRDELGFTGFVVSDWLDMERLHLMHSFSPSIEEAFRVSVESGVDMHMQGPLFYETIIEAVKDGRISEERIDKAVSKILEAKFHLGLFENPIIDIPTTRDQIFTDAHKETALEAARQSIVLLKNDNNTLPLKKGAYKRILLSGPNIDSPTILGDWALQQPKENISTVLSAIKEMCPDAIIDTVGFSNSIHTMDMKTVDLAAQKAKQADLNIVVVGENSERYRDIRTCGENFDRDNLDLPGLQQELLEKVYASGKPTILILLNGRPLSVTWAEENIPAIVEAWEPGSMGGQAIAEILFGDVNPSGKLPMTFPQNVGQVVTTYHHKPSQYSRKFALSKTGALYHFGYGLSYTTYEYGEPQLSASKIAPDDTATVTVDVTNTGDREGTEIVQFYIRDLYASVTRPVKELRGFERVTLKPGETKKVTFDITPEQLQFYTKNKKWEVEPGEFHIMVGGSSRNEDLKMTTLIVE